MKKRVGTGGRETKGNGSRGDAMAIRRNDRGNGIRRKVKAVGYWLSIVKGV